MAAPMSMDGGAQLVERGPQVGDGDRDVTEGWGKVGGRWRRGRGMLEPNSIDHGGKVGDHSGEVWVGWGKVGDHGSEVG